MTMPTQPSKETEAKALELDRTLQRHSMSSWRKLILDALTATEEQATGLADELWLSCLVKLWNKEKGQPWDEADGETREEGIAHNLSMLMRRTEEPLRKEVDNWKLLHGDAVRERDALRQQLAEATGPQTMVFYHLDEQLDSLRASNDQLTSKYDDAIKAAEGFKGKAEGVKVENDRLIAALEMYRDNSMDCGCTDGSFIYGCRHIRRTILAALQPIPQPIPVISGHDWKEDFSHENGNYQNRCITCGTMFLGHKRRVECKICAEKPNSNAQNQKGGEPCAKELKSEASTSDIKTSASHSGSSVPTVASAKTHNPDGLTPEQVGVTDGWRLLDEDEIIKHYVLNFFGIELWKCGRWDAANGNTWKGNSKTYTYRTRLTRAELRKARGLEPEPAKTQDAPTPETDAWEERMLSVTTYAHERIVKAAADFARTLERSRDAALAAKEQAEQWRNERIEDQDPLIYVYRENDWFGYSIDGVGTAPFQSWKEAYRAGEVYLHFRAISTERELRIDAEKERDALKLKWESNTPGKPGCMLRALADAVAIATNSHGSSKPPTDHLKELVSELSTPARDI